MKRIKSILTVLMAAVFAMSLVPVQAWAAPANNDSSVTLTNKTITNPENSGHTYTVYQVFRGTPYTKDGGTERGLKNLVYGHDTTGSDSATTPVARVEGAAVTQADMTYLADVLATADNADDQADIARLEGFFGLANATGTIAAGNTLNVPTGYYVIKDQDDSQDKEGGAYTLYLLKVIDDDITIQPKLAIPTVVKQVADINDTSPGTQEAFAKDADYDIGDDVPFKITATTAANAHNYTKYHVTIQDKQSSGLDAPERYTVTVLGKTFYLDAEGNVYTDSTFEAEVEDGEESQTTANDTKITVSTATPAAGNTFAIRVDFESVADADADGLKLINTEADSTGIVVEYTSELNENAVIGNPGNPNEVYLDYSNNPNDATDTENEGTTEKDRVAVFTYKVDVDKIDQDYRDLTGAGFTLLKKYSALPAGMDAQNVPDLPADGLGADDLDDEGTPVEWFKSGSTYWKVVDTIVNASSASFEWEGIDDGVYRIAETTIPVGYNRAADVEFTVTATHAADGNSATGYSVSALTATATGADPNTFQASVNGGAFTFTKATDNTKTHVMGETTDTEAKVVTAVVNQSGTELPSTGGIGTTIFYVAGTVLVVGAAVMLVAKRRMGAEA